MGLLDQLLHLINFCAPALAVGVVLALVGAMLMKKGPLALEFIARTAINCVAGVLALGLGLWFFGNDGKMASYAAMVLAIGTSQWLGARGRR
jgi:hypothetical protein